MARAPAAASSNPREWARASARRPSVGRVRERSESDGDLPADRRGRHRASERAIAARCRRRCRARVVLSRSRSCEATGSRPCPCPFPVALAPLRLRAWPCARDATADGGSLRLSSRCRLPSASRRRCCRVAVAIRISRSTSRRSRTPSSRCENARDAPGRRGRERASTTCPRWTSACPREPRQWALCRRGRLAHPPAARRAKRRRRARETQCAQASMADADAPPVEASGG